MRKPKPRESFERKVTTTGGYSYYVTIPKDELEGLGWRKGQKVSIRRTGGKLVIQRQKRRKKTHA